jgi:hypothetical protein
MALAIVLLLAVGSAGHASAASLITKPMPPSRLAAKCSKQLFFGMPTWYEYLNLDSQCAVAIKNKQNPGSYFHVIPLIALAVIDILLRVAGMVAIIFVIFGGVELLTSQGSPEKAGKGRGTIINSLIGLAIAVVAIVFVNFVGTSL